MVNEPISFGTGKRMFNNVFMVEVEGNHFAPQFYEGDIALIQTLEPGSTMREGGYYYVLLNEDKTLCKWEAGTNGTKLLAGSLEILASEAELRGKAEPQMDENTRYKAWQVARLLEVYGDEKVPMLGGIPLPRRAFVTTRSGEILADIGLRMFSERELFTAQGFESDFVYNPEVEEVSSDGSIKRRRITKTEVVRMVGNSVPPHFAAAIMGAKLEAEREYYAANNLVQPQRKAA